MLEHALRINAKEQYQNVISAMIPHLGKEDRKQIMDNYQKLIDDEEETSDGVSSDIIKVDRKNLRNLLFKNKNGGQNRLNTIRGKH